MARFDKYDPKTGGFRAFLAVDWPAADVEKPVAVGLDTAGKVVKGAGNTGIVGIVILTRVIKALDEPVDVMTRGEIVEFQVWNGTAYADAPAGTRIYAESSGDFEMDIAGNVPPGAAGLAQSVLVGWTAEFNTKRAARLIVNVMPATVAPTGAA